MRRFALALVLLMTISGCSMLDKSVRFKTSPFDAEKVSRYFTVYDETGAVLYAQMLDGTVAQPGLVVTNPISDIIVDNESGRAAYVINEDTITQIYVANIDGSDANMVAEDEVAEGNGGIRADSLLWFDSDHLLYIEVAQVCADEECDITSNFTEAAILYKVDIVSGEKVIVSNNIDAAVTDEGVTVPSDWETYQNDTHGYEIKYPEEWKATEVSGDSTGFDKTTLPAASEYAGQVFIQVLDEPLGQVLKGQKQLEKFTQNEIVINGVKAIRTQGQMPQDGLFSGTQVAVIFAHESKTYLVGTQYYNSATTREIYNQMISSFEFVEVEEDPETPTTGTGATVTR